MNPLKGHLWTGFFFFLEWQQQTTACPIINVILLLEPLSLQPFCVCFFCVSYIIMQEWVSAKGWSTMPLKTAFISLYKYFLWAGGIFNLPATHCQKWYVKQTLNLTDGFWTVGMDDHVYMERQWTTLQSWANMCKACGFSSLLLLCKHIYYHPVDFISLWMPQFQLEEHIYSSRAAFDGPAQNLLWCRVKISAMGWKCKKPWN